jgi:hypothetical protein
MVPRRAQAGYLFMKCERRVADMKKMVFLIVPLIATATGCVYTHHPVVYSAATTDAALGPTTTEVVTTPTTVVATSPRPAVRVYSTPEPPKMSITTPVPPPVTATTIVPGRIVTTSSSADAAVTASIRQMLEADTARIYRNVDFEVDGGRVIMRGTVPTDHDRIELQNRLVTMPGVVSVDNKLDVELH